MDHIYIYLTTARITLMIWKVWETLYQTTLEEGMATHSNVLAWRIPMDRATWWVTVHGVTKNRTRLSD